MNIFVRLLTSMILAIFIVGCGSSAKTATSNVEQDIQFQQTESNNTISQDENNTQVQEIDDNASVDNEKEHLGEEDLYIVDSSLQQSPNIVLYDDQPSGAKYYYAYDDEKKGYALFLQSTWIENAFHILGYDTEMRFAWSQLPNYQNRFNISWDGKFDDDFIIFIVLKFKTVDGDEKWRDLVYTPTENGYSDYTNDFMHISLGSEANDGQWHSYSRNILDDLRRFYPDAKIDYDDNESGYINGFAVRGSGEITNIKLSY